MLKGGLERTPERRIIDQAAYVGTMEAKKGPPRAPPGGARGHFITQRCAFHNREPYESRIRVTARGGFAPLDPPAIYIEVNYATEAAKERSTPRTLLSITFAQHPHPHARRCAQHCEFAARSTLASAPRRVKPRALNLHCTEASLTQPCGVSCS